ncbi:MAG: hypothetical protein KC445_10940 [Anaerolineales bacterium]|nr:hypothetical protein [Anaerolineales bacterium]
MNFNKNYVGVPLSLVMAILALTVVFALTTQPDLVEAAPSISLNSQSAINYRVLSSRSVDPAVFAGERNETLSALSEIASPLAMGVYDVIADGGFEGGIPNASWDEYFYPDDVAGATPLCSNSSCANIAYAGNWYAWYGEWGTLHHAALTQTVYLTNTNDAQLTFWLLTADSVFGSMQPTDALTVTIDGNPVFTIDASQADTYDLLWTKIEVDVGSYADGGDHVLSIESATIGSWFVDQVALQVLRKMYFLPILFKQ